MFYKIIKKNIDWKSVIFNKIQKRKHIIASVKLNGCKISIATSNEEDSFSELYDFVCCVINGAKICEKIKKKGDVEIITLESENETLFTYVINVNNNKYLQFANSESEEGYEYICESLFENEFEATIDCATTISNFEEKIKDVNLKHLSNILS